ncbi:hypothetical protein ACWDBF_02245 [Streptomyces angustmyceticus]|uniref:hypothetical protein n=1 Tax=Streptomyces angustmyceticus TaxID=285578 RepID=UPI0028BD87CF|nr:hypothetical protein [Streptomyces angustmyceticus]
MQEHTVKNTARVNFVMAGACGLLLAAGGAAPTPAWAGSSGDGVSNSNTVARFDARFHCGPRARFCVNGPVLSGNPGRAQNVYVGGSNSNSGSPKNNNGNTNEDSGGTTGAAKKSSNNMQHVGHHGSQKL